jgi:hypothetical protein
MAGEWKTTSDTPVHPTLEAWIWAEAKGGRKLEAVMFTCGATMRCTIRWTDGTRQQLIVGERAPWQVCVLAKRSLDDGDPPDAP